jgi:hypothetical protein
VEVVEHKLGVYGDDGVMARESCVAVRANENGL